MSIVEKPLLTAEEFLSLPDAKRFELVDGRLVEKEMSYWSAYVAGTIYRLLSQYVLTHGLGWVAPAEVSFRCFTDDPEKIRRPDVSFIRLERLPPDRAQELRVIDIPPDLAVEVLSPNDLAYQVADKVTDYLQAGVRRVWVVNPVDRTMAIHQLDGGGSNLRGAEEVIDEELLPGFRVSLADFFALPTPPSGA